MDFLKLLIPTFIFYLVVDYIWLGFIASKFYSQELGMLVHRKSDGGIDISLFPGIVAYVFLVLGLILFVYPKIQNSSNMMSVLVYGFLFGIIVYGVYDMTNLATLKNFGVHLAVVDMLWGGFVCALTTLFIYFISRMID